MSNIGQNPELADSGSWKGVREALEISLFTKLLERCGKQELVCPSVLAGSARL